MPTYLVIVDIFGAVLAVVGFVMAFRQAFVRDLLGVKATPRSSSQPDDEDPLTYVLRIAGIMMAVFGIALAGMMTLAHLS